MKAFRKAFPEPFKALEHLKDLAKAAHTNGSQSLVWTTPTGDYIEDINIR